MPRIFQHILALLVFLGAGAAGGRESGVAPPADALDPGSSSHGPRKLFELFGIDEPFWSGFKDDVPLDATEREKLLAVLVRLRQFAPATIEENARPLDELATIDEGPQQPRGDLFSFRGRARRVVREVLEPELAERLSSKEWYRCEITTDSGGRVVVVALSVPAEWKLDAAIDEPCGVQGVFIKRLAEPLGDGAGASEPGRLFAAGRVAWYPPNLLGQLGMDVGLLDDVRDRAKLDERECFYQMLAAVRRASERQIDEQARRNLETLRESLPGYANDPGLDAKQRLAARRTLARAERGASDVVPLFNDPANQRGKLFVLRGEALRAIEVRVDDPDIVARFGIDHYYEVDVFTEDSQNHPLVCCVAELPPEMPRGEYIREHVVVCGFFLKSWAYGAAARAAHEEPGDARGRQLLAPMLIAKTLRWSSSSGSSVPGAGIGIALVAAVVASIAALWFIAGGARRASRSARHNRDELPETIALDPLQTAPEENAQ